MIVEMSGKEAGVAKHVAEALRSRELTVNIVEAGGRLHIATSGDQRNIDLAWVASFPGVGSIIPEPPPFHFASLKFRPEPTTVMVGGVGIGGGEKVVIAGVCAVENREDTFETARLVKEQGAHIFRGGAYKPRTSPYNFQGIGRRGLEILAEVREKIGLPVVSEVLDPADIEAACECCDAIQVGTRNMTNTALLRRLGKASKPILLKRSFSAKIEELVRAAEFIIVYGNPNVILCERGIQTFETYTRFTLDLAAVPALKELSHLPVIVDPSHGTGRPSLIPPMARAALAAGADGISVECHVAPERMLKPGDDFQALRPDAFRQFMHDMRTCGVSAAHGVAD